MAYINKLPNEILVEIFAYEGVNLGGLALTSKQFCPVAQSLIFESAEFDLYEARYRNFRWRRFCQSIDKNPDLGSYVRSLELTCYLPRMTPCFSRSCQTALLKLSKNLGKLRHLRLHDTNDDSDGPESDPHSFITEFISRCLREGPFDLLQSVTLSGLYFESLPVIFESMAHKSITSMNSNFENFRDNDDRFLLEHDEAPSPSSISNDRFLLELDETASPSSIRKLEIGYGHSVQGRVLEEIFRRTTALEELVVEIQEKDSFRVVSRKMWAEAWSFKPIMSSLVELFIFGFEEYDWQILDMRFDFSGFESLKFLHLPSSYLFTYYPCPRRSGLFRFLPSSLEELKIRYINWGDDCIFVEVDNTNMTIYQENYEWLLELAAHKVMYGTRLRYTRIFSTAYCTRNPCPPDEIVWAVPETSTVLKTCYDGSGNLVLATTPVTKSPPEWEIPRTLVSALSGASIKFRADFCKWYN